jgi:hypothetical protein
MHFIDNIMHETNTKPCYNGISIASAYSGNVIHYAFFVFFFGNSLHLYIFREVQK